MKTRRKQSRQHSLSNIETMFFRTENENLGRYLKGRT